MELHELLLGETFCAIENLARTIVRLPYFAFLLVRQCHDAQGEDLVDLRAIEEATRTLWSDLRMVVENDGRRQHSLLRIVFTDQHGPGPYVLAFRDQRLVLRGRFEQGEERAVLHAQDGVRRDQREEHCFFSQRFGGRGEVRIVAYQHPDLEEVIAQMRLADLNLSREMLPLAHDDAND